MLWVLEPRQGWVVECYLSCTSFFYFFKILIKTVTVYVLGLSDVFISSTIKMLQLPCQT